ncbi:putative reverse transcriptase domain-containing protein [Tanacetum coccineum]
MGHSTYECRRASRDRPLQGGCPTRAGTPTVSCYVPDPMELDKHVSVYVLEPEHQEYHAPSNDDIQVEDQPYADDASPTAESPRHITDSESMKEDSINYPDETKDENEDPEEDPEEDHTDYPADGEDGDDEPSDDDDDDDDTDDEDEEPTKDEEEEHLALADSSVVPVVDSVPSARDIEAFKTDESTPTPRSPQTRVPFSQTHLRRAWKTVRLEPPISASMEARIAEPVAAPIPPTSSVYDQAPPGHRLAMICMRDDIPEDDMPLWRRFVLTTPPPGCDVAESSTPTAVRPPRGQYDFVDTVKAGQGSIRSLGHDARTIARAADRAEDVGYVRRQESADFYIQLLDARTNRRDIRLEIDVVKGQRTAYETELHEVRQAYLSSEARNRAVLARLETLETHISRMAWQRQRAKDDAVRQMMCIYVLEAKAQIDTVEDIDSSYKHVSVYVLEPEHQEYHAPSNDDIQVEDQPYADDASPTAESPRHITDSESMKEDSINYPDETKDENEDPEEDPEEDHTDYPADGEDGDDEPSDDDDDDDDTDDEDEEPTKDEEEEHLALADSSAVPVVDPVPSARDIEEFKTDESAPTPRSPQTRVPFSQTRLRKVWKTVRLEPPISASMEARITEPAAAPIPTTSPVYDQAPPCHRLAMICIRDGIPEEDMPLWRRFVLTTPPPGCDVAESSTPTAVRPPRGQYDFVDTVKAGQGSIRSLGHDARTIARAADRAEDVGYVRALQASEHMMMTSIEEVNLRVSYQAQIDVVRGQRTAYETELHECFIIVALDLSKVTNPLQAKGSRSIQLLFGVNTAGGTSSSNQVSSTSGADEVVCSFFSQQTTSPPLDNEDLQQIDQDELEELDIIWQVAMLTVRVQRFIQKTRRNLDFKGKQPVTFDKSNVECYNCHRKGHFAKECKSGRNQGKRSYGDNGRRNATTNEPSSQALVAQDDLGGYDWSNDFDELVNYALMAISSSSSSRSSDNEVRSSDEEITPANDRFSKVDGYHVVPPLITGNFLTPRADISFAGLDEYAIRKKIIESKTTKLNTDTSKSKTSVTVGVLTRTSLVNPVRPNGKRAVHTVSTARPISTARPGNPEICLQDHAVEDSGCSSHMTGNKACNTPKLGRSRIRSSQTIHGGQMVYIRDKVDFDVTSNVADFSHAPLNEYSPSPNDKNSVVVGVGWTSTKFPAVHVDKQVEDGLSYKSKFQNLLKDRDVGLGEAD